MEKNNETATSRPSKLHRIKIAFIKLVILAAIIAAGYGMWKNPQIVEQIKGMFQSKEPTSELTVEQQVRQLQNQLVVLQNQLNEYSSREVKNAAGDDIIALQERMRTLEKTNLNVIDSKADVAVVLGLLTRLDKAEGKLDTLAKVTDNSALVLTAAMLVKDSAERGGSFNYEMEVLNQLGADNLKLKQPLAEMSKYAAKGIVTQERLDKEFSSIYKQIIKQEKEAFEQTWTDRINSKLSEIVQIKKVNEKAPKFEANQNLEKIRQLVNEHNISAAIAELEKPSNADLLKDEKLKSWLEEARSREDFYDALTQITAGSLAIMKVNFLKSQTTDN